MPPSRFSPSFRLACDLDGTLADMEGALQQVAERLYGRRGVDRAMLTEEQHDAMWAAVEAMPDFWTTLEETESGAVARLAAVASAKHWEVIFLTRRPPTAGDTAQRQSQRWLQAHGFPMPSVYVMPGSRGRLADVLDLHAILDDEPANCVDVATHSSARAVLLWRGAPGAAPAELERLEIETVMSLDDALLSLDRIAARAVKRTGSGFLSRLREAIGV
jgi:hypothetical protein